jgi:hypothetical protein
MRASTHVGTWIQRTNDWYWFTAVEFSIHSSNAEIAAAAIALEENNKYTGFWRRLHQIAR